MSDDLYSNLLRATDNTADITTEKQGTITKIQDKLCNVKEEATGLEHTNVPVINEVQVKEGDTVLLGFLDNNIYNPVVYGVIGREIKATIDVDNELSSISENPVQNKTITTALNNKANNNHSHTSVEVVEGTALTHIGTGAEASQQEVNIAVDSKVDDLNRNVNSLQSEVGSLSNSITNLVQIQYIQITTPSTISAGGTGQVTITVTPLPTGYRYLFFMRKGANGIIYNDQLSGSTLTLTAQNLVSSSQKVYIRGYLVYVPESWSYVERVSN